MEEQIELTGAITKKGPAQLSAGPFFCNLDLSNFDVIQTNCFS